MEQVAIEHIERAVPANLHDALIPKDVFGCKRRVNDGTDKGGYLACVNDERMTLVANGVSHIKGDSIVSTECEVFPVDAMVFGTG